MSHSLNDFLKDLQKSTVHFQSAGKLTNKMYAHFCGPGGADSDIGKN